MSGAGAPPKKRRKIRVELIKESSGDEEEEDGDLGEFIPNPQIDVHWRQLTKRPSEREEKKNESHANARIRTLQP